MEVLRGGIEAVDPGQNEAARSLGLSQWQAMIKVVFPQGVKNAIPALSNELVVNIKDSSVLSVIGVFDLMFATKTVVGIYFKQVELYVVATLCYLFLTMVASWLLGKFAQRLSVEPQPLTSVSDMNATVGTVAGTGSSEYSLDKKKAR
jgi:putative lysine transport system permease protein